MIIKGVRGILATSANKLFNEVTDQLETIDNIGDMQLKVMTFMQAAGQEISIFPQDIDMVSADTKALRIRLIKEEVLHELIPALETDNLPEIIDGICDSIYVILGTAAAYGIPTGFFFEQVHHNNMTKVDKETGKFLKDVGGKIIKPEGYKKIEIAELLTTMEDMMDKNPSIRQSAELSVKKLLATLIKIYTNNLPLVKQ